MSHHAWCSDPARDEAVRAAEDGRTGPLPTLEEAISAVSPLPGRVDGTHWADWERLRDERDAAIRERDEAIAEPFAEAAKRSPTVSKTSETQSGLRTERVTLEITHSVPVGLWDWTNILETYRPGESVRVVEEFGDALPRVVEDMAAEIKRLDSERDAAIQQHSRECVKCSALADKVIGLKARVASLESQLESVACRAATAENRVAELESAAKAAADASEDGESNHAAQAASGAAGTEPDAWGVRRSGGIDAVAHRLFRSSAEQSAEQNGGTVVPLYASPPPAPGWLTEEDRETLLRLSYVVDYAQYATSADFIRSLLARSTPPEVELPEIIAETWAFGKVVRVQDVVAALAAAGVPVKEVGE